LGFLAFGGGGIFTIESTKPNSKYTLSFITKTFFSRRKITVR